MSFGGWATSAEGLHPNVAIALYALAVVAAGTAAVLILVSRQSTLVNVEGWRQQEKNFRQINKNIQAHWDRETGSRILRWSLWLGEDATPRDRELFEGEAIHASRLLRKTLGYSDAKFQAWFGSNEVDQWLTAIRALVHPGTDMHSRGVDEHGTRSAGHFIEEVPVMSAVACVKLAAGVRPRISVVSNLE